MKETIIEKAKGILDYLQPDMEQIRREEFLSNPDAASEQIEEVYDSLVREQSSNTHLFSEIARHPHTRSAILSCLVHHPCSEVEGMALQKLNDEGVTSVLALNPRTPADILKQIYEKGIYTHELAENPSTPVFIMEILAIDDNKEVRRLLAESPSLPTTIATRLAEDSNPKVKTAAIRSGSYKGILDDKYSDIIEQMVQRTTVEGLPALMDIVRPESFPSKK